MEKGTSKILAFLLGITIGCATSFSAKAADLWDFIQISCVPELHYFSLHAFSVENNDINGKLERLHNEENIWLLKDLEKKPYTCTLPAAYQTANTPTRVYAVKVAKQDNARSFSNCNDHIEINLNGKKIDEFYAFGKGRCTDDGDHLITADAFFFRNCFIAKHGTENEKCSHIRLIR